MSIHFILIEIKGGELIRRHAKELTIFFKLVNLSREIYILPEFNIILYYVLLCRLSWVSARRNIKQGFVSNLLIGNTSFGVFQFERGKLVELFK